jgi:hypothetical protein
MVLKARFQKFFDLLSKNSRYHPGGQCEDLFPLFILDGIVKSQKCPLSLDGRGLG